MRNRAAGWGVAVCLVAFGAAASAHADWIVRKDGRRIEARGQSVIVDGIVGYFDQEGKVQTFAVEELDVDKTRFANLVARRRREAGEHFVIEDSQFSHSDRELNEAVHAFETAETYGVRQAALRKLNALLDRLGGTPVLALHCGERYGDWMAQAFCRLGRPVPSEWAGRAPLTGKADSRHSEDLGEAVRDFQCRRLYPHDAIGFRVCRAAKE